MTGNEKADQLAKDALQKRAIKKLKLDYRDCYNIIKRFIFSEWQKEWNDNNCFMQRVKPDIKEWESSYQKNRKEEIVLSRLRMCCTLLDVKHFYEGMAPPVCEECNVRLTSKHVLMDCTKYTQERVNVVQHLNESNVQGSIYGLLGDGFPISLLISFLRKTGLLHLF